MAIRADGVAGRLERSRHAFSWIVVGLVCVGAGIRISIALAAPIFAEHDPIGLFRSDPFGNYLFILIEDEQLRC